MTYELEETTGVVYLIEDTEIIKIEVQNNQLKKKQVP